MSAQLATRPIVAPSKRAEQITLRMAHGLVDGPRIGELARQGGFALAGEVDWTRLGQNWLAAEFGGEIVGAIQICPGLPFGRLEMLMVERELKKRTRVDVAKYLAYRASAMLAALGSQYATMLCLPGSEFHRLLLRRGCVKQASGDLLIKRLER